MSFYRVRYLAVAVLVLGIAAGAGLLILRPDLMPYGSFRAGIDKIRSYVPGQTAEEQISDKSWKTVGETPTATVGGQAPEKKDLYLIEFKSGGRVYTDNLEIGDGKLTYETDTGLVVTINSYEVTGVQKFQEGQGPDS